MRIIAIANQKGGCGKTTTAINLSACLTEKGCKTLLIDMDPQSHAGIGLGIDVYKLEKSMYEVLVQPDVGFYNIIRKTEIPGLEIAPATIMLSGAEIDLANAIGRENVLKECMQELQHQYDYVIIDCPPSLSLLTVNALTAADDLLAPVHTQYFPLEGVKQLLKTIDIVKSRLNNKLNVLGILPTLFDKRTKLSRDVLSGIKDYFREKTFNTVINNNIKLAEAPSAGKSIISYDRSSLGAMDYQSLAEEVIAREKKIRS